MKNALRYAVIIAVAFFLTALTQVGGVIYLLSILTHRFLSKRFKNRQFLLFMKSLAFWVLYLITTFLILPPIAKRFGRVPLTAIKTGNVRPLNIITCLFNRNYVKPELKITLIDVADEMAEKYPGTIVNYLDAGFPFIDGYPMLPHLSHNDGKKLDVSFCYLDAKTMKQTNNVPSVIGYGIGEEPRANEMNTAKYCSECGNWQYSILTKLVPGNSRADFIFDSVRTKELVRLFCSKPAVSKIFIEPHLKTRLNLTNNKIRFQGCHAIRHDDHVHLQIK